LKKIMILGAGIYQVPLIKAAQDMGLYTIVASIPGEYPGFALADQVCTINTTDQQEILKVCLRENIQAICTTGTDVAVSTIGYVCQHMGLPGISLSAARNVTDKAQMKAAFERGHVSASRFRQVNTLEKARKAASEIGYPVVVKRVDSSGSRGITVVKDPEYLAAAFDSALSGSRRDYVLVEEKLHGMEVGADGLIQNGEIVFFVPHGKSVYHTGTIDVPAGHSLPWQGSPVLSEEIRRQLNAAVQALGLDNCPFNADLFVDPDTAKVWIIEIGGRTGATCIPELISMYYGFDYYEKILKNALGEPLSLSSVPHGSPCRAMLLMSPFEGRITSVDQDILHELTDQGITVTLDYPVGHPVEKMENGTCRFGHVIFPVHQPGETDRILRKLYSSIHIDEKPLSWDHNIKPHIGDA